MTHSEEQNGSLLPGLQSLWAETTGRPEVLIAVLDGPADLSHPCFAGADITTISDDEFPASASGTAAQHGTHVASIIFGQHGSEVQGIAPKCRGLLIPIFDNRADGTIIPCSEIKLASAILRAVREAERIAPGASLVINISGGQFSRTGQGHPLLADAVRRCNEKNVLLVAAAGNEGCECLHVPGAMPSVLVAGAMDSAGMPLPMSNWGAAYRTQGILAPGENILGAMPGGGAVHSSGTSFAAPVVSGVAALLLSLQSKLGKQPNPQQIGKALLASAVKCNPESISNCRQYLAGVLNIDGAVSIITEGGSRMPEQTEMQDMLDNDDEGEVMDDEVSEPEEVVMSSKPAATKTVNEQDGVKMSQVPAKSKCGCDQEKWSDKFVYVIGQLGVDFVNQARQDSLQFHADGDINGNPLPITQPVNLLRYLQGWSETAADGKAVEHKPHMYDAKSIYWVLSQNGAPLYVVQPMGPFAEDGYRELVDFYAGQISEAPDVQHVAISGVVVGEAQLSTNEVVPIIVPHMRGTAAWSTKHLCGELACSFDALPPEVIEQILVRMYEETRNYGLTPEERAVNYVATNVFEILEAAKILPGLDVNQKWELDSIKASKSAIARTGSECYDVQIAFYNPDNLVQARRITVVTVDVSDVVPVMIGNARHFSKR
jgi:hypothetical protein